MNPIAPRLVTGAVGELLVQLRLLQFDVQSAPPLKDSGNDLIAVRAHTFRAIQIKTTVGETYPVDRLPEFYHLLAVVHLVGEDSNLLLDRSRVFLLPHERVADAARKVDKLGEFELCREHVEELFGARHYEFYKPIA